MLGVTELFLAKTLTVSLVEKYSIGTSNVAGDDIQFSVVVQVCQRNRVGLAGSGSELKHLVS